MKRLIPVLAVLVLAGCGGDMTAGSGSSIREGTECNARANQRLVGQSADDRAALAALAPKVRFINPGDAVTQDFQEDRINLELDANGIITRVYCG